MRLLAALLAVALLTAACSTTPRFPADSARSEVFPSDVAVDEARYLGTHVLWGGTIVDVRNREERTVLEILSYPLNDEQRPDSEGLAGARFLAVSPSFLDPQVWRAGREVTVLGTVMDVATLRIDRSEQRAPRVKITDIELWENQSRGRVTPGGRFGLGIGIQF